MRVYSVIAGMLLINLGFTGCAVSGTYRARELDASLLRVRQRIQQEREVNPAAPDSPTYERAIGAYLPPPRASEAPQAECKLTLGECLRLAFANSKELEQARQELFAVGGDELIAKARFLPAVEVVSQYEDFHSSDDAEDFDPDHAYVAGVRFRQRILEFGKDSPTDIGLRAQQRAALFAYEATSADVLSRVRRAFFVVILKRDQIAVRRELLAEFEKQYERKKARMEAGNLSVRVELLTARLNVLNEKTRINALVREQVNRSTDLLRLVGLPLRGEAVTCEGDLDTFALEGLDEAWALDVALAQSPAVAFFEARVADQKRRVDDVQNEYLPDLRLSVGYQQRNMRVSTDLSNEGDTWALDVLGQPQVSEEQVTLPLDSVGVYLPGPDPGAFAGVQLRIPIFEGNARTGRRIRERAVLARLQAALDDEKDSVAVNVRQAYEQLLEQRKRVELEQERVTIARERLDIKDQLRGIGRITDDELETFRTQFFEAQDSLFEQQEILIDRQEDLRLGMRYFR